MTEKPESMIELADRMWASLKATPEFYEAFDRVKFDSLDGDERDDDRFVVIVAKGEHADRIAEAYDHGE